MGLPMRNAIGHILSLLSTIWLLRSIPVGRPKKTEISIWDKKYYRLSDKRDQKALDKVKEERLIKAYNHIHLMAFDKEMSWTQTNAVRKML